jgi:hypothetical protein
LCAPFLNFIYAHKNSLTGLVVFGILFVGVATASYFAIHYGLANRNGTTIPDSASQPTTTPIILLNWAIIDTTTKTDEPAGRLSYFSDLDSTFAEDARAYPGYRTYPYSYTLLCQATDYPERPYCLNALQSLSVQSQNIMAKLELAITEPLSKLSRAYLRLPIEWSCWFINDDELATEYCLDNGQVSPCPQKTRGAPGH